MNIFDPTQVHVLIDSANMDMVLTNILGAKPQAEQRPRWDRLYSHCKETWNCTRPKFVLNGDRFAQGQHGVMAFRRILRHMGYSVETPRAVDLGKDPDDQFIINELKMLRRYGRSVSVVLFSHDGGYAPFLDELLMLNANVQIVGFPEEMSPKLLKLRFHGARIVDFEKHVHAFLRGLPRPQVNF
jgi:putative heme uptake system protein